MAWDHCNTMVMVWVTSFINPEILESILWMETAQEIWEELRERYHHGDIFIISKLQEHIYVRCQGDQTNIQFFTTLKRMCQEHDNFRTISSYTCVFPCSSTLLAIIKTYKDNNHVIHFLKGLNEQYSHV